jgi:hypothetical protein
MRYDVRVPSEGRALVPGLWAASGGFPALQDDLVSIPSSC